MEDVRKICKLIWEKNFTTQTCKFLKKRNINYYSTYSIMKISVVERFNCTLKNDMWKQFTQWKLYYKLIDCLLPRLVFEYNVRKHRIIDAAHECDCHDC